MYSSGGANGCCNSKSVKEKATVAIHVIVFPLGGCVYPLLLIIIGVTQTTESVLAPQSPLQTTVRMGEGGKWLSSMERAIPMEYSICQHGDSEKAKLVDECIR